MSRRSQYDQLADKISAELRRNQERKKPWREALAYARALSQILGMCPSIRDDAGNTISETNDGCLRFSDERTSFAEDDLEKELVARGLQDHQWH